jgi:transcriptional regulator with XRE-family HTH domain
VPRSAALRATEEIQDARSAEVLARATLRAANLLGLSQKHLAAILGVSEASVSRLDRGRGIEPASKEGEIALFFLRIWRSLDALAGGDEAQAKTWMQSENDHLDGVPARLIQSLAGMVRVADYLDAMRGKL